jgi:hypothetical protein
MRRRAPGEHVEPFRHRVHADEGHELREALAEWTATVATELENAWPTMSPGVTDVPPMSGSRCWPSLMPLVATGRTGPGEHASSW